MSYAGVLAERNKNEKIAIVSGDKGFISAVEMLQSVTSNVIILCESIDHAVNCFNGQRIDIAESYVKKSLSKDEKTEEISPELEMSKAFFRKKEAAFRLKDDPKSAKSKLIRKNIQKILSDYGGIKLATNCELVRVVYMMSDSYDDFENCLIVKGSAKASEICSAMKEHYKDVEK